MKTLRGFSYVEVLVATFLIGTVLVPATELLSNAMQGSEIHIDQASGHYHLVAKMEELLAKPLTELREQADSVGSATILIEDYSDNAGTTQRRLVYLSRYDADNADGDNDFFTGTEQDLLWLQVKIEGSDIFAETLIGSGP